MLIFNYHCVRVPLVWSWFSSRVLGNKLTWGPALIHYNLMNTMYIWLFQTPQIYQWINKTVVTLEHGDETVSEWAEYIQSECYNMPKQEIKQQKDRYSTVQ